MSIGPLWESVKQQLDALFASVPEEAKTQQIVKQLTSVQTALVDAPATMQLPLAGAMARSLNREPRWIVFCLALSALGGVLALTAAVLHAVKQVNQLHASETDDALAVPAAPAAAIHIDHYTPMMLALMSLLRWPHSIYIKDRKMLCFQVANVLVWGGITVYVWVNDPHPSLPHIDL